MLVPTAWPEVLTETPTTALVSGNWTFGHVAAKYAMEVAIAKARDQNVATVSLVKALHIGRVGEYAEMAVATGMIALVWASGYGAEVPVAVPFGGRAPVLHTNPIAIGVPAGEETPMVMDFATNQDRRLQGQDRPAKGRAGAVGQPGRQGRESDHRPVRLPVGRRHDCLRRPQGLRLHARHRVPRQGARRRRRPPGGRARRAPS